MIPIRAIQLTLQAASCSSKAQFAHHFTRAALLHSTERRSLSSSAVRPPRHNHLNKEIGIGSIPLAPEELLAESELENVLPEFQQAMQVLSGTDEKMKSLSNTKRAALALPLLQRTADICRTAMGKQSAYLLTTLRHLSMTHMLQGDYKLSKQAMRERGELMHWPITEQERMLRLLLRQNQPQEAFEWCEKDLFKQLTHDDIIPLKWKLYELIGKSMREGEGGLALDDPTFTREIQLLRDMKQVVMANTSQEDKSENKLAREIPYLLSQYASLCLVSTGSTLNKTMEQLSPKQRASLDNAEALWKEALTWVQKTASEEGSEQNATALDAPFEAWVQTNLGELLLRQHKQDEAMELLGQALQTQQQQKGGNALALCRVLAKIAEGCHVVGQAVSSEGLFTTVVESYAKEEFLSLTDRVEYSKTLRAYGRLLQSWDKREANGKQKEQEAGKMDQQIRSECDKSKCQMALDPVFYLPL